jgi:hypothetical protein
LKVRFLLIVFQTLACSGLELGALPDQGEESTGLVLLIHGSGDDALDWAQPLAEEIHKSLVHPELWDVAAYDWSEQAANKLLAAGRGFDHGLAIGEVLALERDYTAVQIISHSVGGHVSHGIAQTWTDGVLQQTFLDPFGGRGLVRWNYGHNRFGETGSFSETYFNADDGVPSTDRPPRHTHGFDVTALRDSSTGEDPHWWPIEWYRNSLGSGVGLDLSLPFEGEESWVNFPAGEQTLLAP